MKLALYLPNFRNHVTVEELEELVFLPGLSTAEAVTEVSGRGVGMDVVKTKISQLNGSINIYSTKGQGSKIVIKVPLTLAIMPTLMVMLGNQAFAFPLVNVNEIFHLDLSRTNVVDGQEVRNAAWYYPDPKPAAARTYQGIASSPLVRNGVAYYMSNRAELMAVDIQGFHDNGENDGPYREEVFKDDAAAEAKITELKAIAAPAIMGSSRKPLIG